MAYIYYVIYGGEKHYIEFEYDRDSMIRLIKEIGCVSTICTDVPIYDSLDGHGFTIASSNIFDKWINKVSYD